MQTEFGNAVRREFERVTLDKYYLINKREKLKL
jgi:hypothetical protein